MAVAQRLHFRRVSLQGHPVGAASSQAETADNLNEAIPRCEMQRKLSFAVLHVDGTAKGAEILSQVIEAFLAS